MEIVIYILKIIINYILPIIAIMISISAHISSSKLNDLELKLKKYEIEEKEKEIRNRSKVHIESRLIRNENVKTLVIFNSGNETAYNINIEYPDEVVGSVLNKKTPYESLKSGDDFEEKIYPDNKTPRKFKIKILWENKDGEKNSKIDILSY
jgi:hypothetical protein